MQRCSALAEAQNNAGSTPDSALTFPLSRPLCRDLHDKYKLRLTEEAKRQIRMASSDPDHANSLFLRTQYDVLRRLRAYWVPRFLIHKEREISGHTLTDLHVQSLRRMGDGRSSSAAAAATEIFPSLSLANSMPVRPDVAYNMARVGSWDQVRAGGRRLDDRIKSAQPLRLIGPTHPPCTPLRFANYSSLAENTQKY